MTTITSNRGTSTTTDDGLVYGKKSSVLPQNTKVIKTEDIPTQKMADLKGQTITVNRGTAIKTL